MKNNLKKNFIWNIIGSTVNSFTSLFFLIIVTRINGIDNAGIFTFAFSNACFLQVIGIYVTRVFQVTDNNKKTNDSDYIYCKLITCLLMMIFVTVFCVIRSYELVKFTVVVLLVFYKALDAFSESLYSIIQKDNKLYKVGISLFAKGVIGTIVFIATNILTRNMIISIIALIISNMLVIAIYDFIAVKGCDFKLSKFNFNSTKIILKLGFWTFVFTFLTQYLINASKYAIDSYLESDMQTIYGIISMPATVMMLVSNFIIHPFLVGINKDVVDNNYKGINKTLVKMLLAIIVIGLMALGCAYFLGIPVLNLLYAIKLDDYLIELVIIIIGATVFALTIIISNIMISLRKTMSQTVIFIITSVITFFVSNYLVKNYSVLGASCSYLSSMSILLVLYIIIYIFAMINIRKEKKN